MENNIKDIECESTESPVSKRGTSLLKESGAALWDIFREIPSLPWRELPAQGWLMLGGLLLFMVAMLLLCNWNLFFGGI